MVEHDIQDKILIYLYKFRDDSDFHDLFELFEQKEYDVIWDKVNSLYKERMLVMRHEVSFFILGDETEPRTRLPKKHDLFVKITKPGIEYVKNDIIRQTEIDTLRRQKTTNDKRIFRATIIVPIILALPTVYSIYLTDKTNTLEQELIKRTRQRDSLSTVIVDQYNLLKTKDKEITKTKFYLDSLTDSLKVDKQTKNK